MVGFVGLEQEMSNGFARGRHGLRVGRHIFVKTVGLIAVQLTGGRVKSIIYDGSCPYALVT